MKSRIVVGAHYGLRDWLAQRITACVMALFTVVFVIQLLMLPEYTYEAWRAMFAGGFMRFITFLFWMSLFYHAWVGLRDFFMDYVQPVGIRLALHCVVLLLLVGYAGWAAQILWRL